MRPFMKLVETSIREDVRGETVYTSPHRHLYHMTSSHGFAYTISRNSLESKNYGYVSTTYDASMNGFTGGHHAHFKFILNGQKLAQDFGCFSYDYHATVVGSGERVSLDEREIGINTNKIRPFDQYVEGLVLLFNPFSQTAVQWMFYENSESNGLFTRESAAPRTMDMMIKFRDEMSLPIYLGPDHRMMNRKELQIFKDFEELHHDGADFDTAMREVAAKHPIVDHMRRPLDKTTVIRLQKADKITDMLNGYFTKVKLSDLKPQNTKRLLSNIFVFLGLGNNQTTVLMQTAEENNFFHPLVAPVDWGIVIRDAMYGEIEDAVDYMQRWQKKNQWSIDRYRDPEHRRYLSPHAGTRLA